MPKVTVVTPAYNSAKYIATAIESVRAQSIADWEMLVVDDASDDDTVAIVEQYAKLDPRVVLITHEYNSGAAAARNTATRAAKGRYISFLDSDDCWLPHKLEAQLAFIRAVSAPFVFSAYRKIDESGQDVGLVGVPDTVSYRDILKSNYIGCLTVMYDSHQLGKVEAPLMRAHEDFALWLRLLKKTPLAYGQQEVLALYTIRGGSLSADKRTAAAYQWKVYRDIEQLELTTASYYFAHYAIRGVLRSRFPCLARKLGVLHGVGKNNA